MHRRHLLKLLAGAGLTAAIPRRVAALMLPLRLRVGAREGIAVRVSQADLVEAVELLRTSPSAGNCADVTEPGDLALAGLVVSPGEAGVSLSLDAVAIGRTAETLPTAETSPPACLQP